MDASELLGQDFEQLQVVREPSRGLLAVIAVHSTALGPAHGGIRRWRYPTTAAAAVDALALARAMTWKCALAGVPAGGGKAVIHDDPGLDRAFAYRRVGEFVEQMGGRFFTGPDVGTTDDDLREVARATRFVAAPGRNGPGDLGEATARGVFAALTALTLFLERELPGLRVAVQGLGAVGMKLCGLLAGAGARLLVADVAAERTATAAREFGAEVLAADAILAAECDVLAPCALGAVLDERAAPELRAGGVCGAANNVLADAATGLMLHRRGIPVVPDFVANAGALIQGATFHLQGRRPDPARIDRIGAVAGEILARARREDVPPGELALRMARERVAAAGDAIYLPPRR